jgi:hypothetical protein
MEGRVKKKKEEWGTLSDVSCRGTTSAGTISSDLVKVCRSVMTIIETRGEFQVGSWNKICRLVRESVLAM